MKKGFTLIEIVVAMALLTILLATIPQIMGGTVLKISDNGRDINKVNSAKTEMNRAISNPSYTSDTVTQEIVTVDVLGTPVSVRKIESKISGISLSDGTDDIFLTYAPMESSPEVPSGGSSEIFIDKGYDGEFTEGVDDIVEDDELGNFNYGGNGNLVIGREPDIGNGNININIRDSVIIGSDVILDGKDINIESNGVTMEDNSTIHSQNGDVNINSTGDVNLGSSSTIDVNHSITIKCDDLNVAEGTTVQSKNDNIDVIASGDVNINNGEFTVSGNGSVNIKGNNIVITNNSIINTQNSEINITSTNGNILINNKSTVAPSSKGKVTISTSGNIEISEEAVVKTSNEELIIDGDTVKILSGAEITADNGSIETYATELYLAGTSSKITRMTTSNNDITLSVDSMIHYGVSGASVSNVVFSSKTGEYAYNVNKTPFDPSCVAPEYKDSKEQYFK